MADINLETMWLEGYNIAEDFGWWCLGHNFDVVATILTMADLSWRKGWDARGAIESIASSPVRTCHPGDKCNYWPEC